MNHASNHMPKQPSVAHTHQRFAFSSVWFLSLGFYDDGTRRPNVKFEACHSAALTCWRDSHRVESKLAQHERYELDVCPDRAGALQPLQSRACGATPLGTSRSSTAHGRNVIRRGQRCGVEAFTMRMTNFARTLRASGVEKAAPLVS